MTPEEEFNQEVWQVMQKARKAELATVGKHIEYKFPHFVGVGIISKERQKKILYKLQDWGALKIRENPWEPPESTPDTFYLNLIQPRFNETYERLQKACDIKSYLNNYQEKAFKNENLPKFSKVGQEELEINKWLESKDEWAIEKIWQVVSALHSEWQLRDENTFDMPHDKFERARVTNPKDLEAILRSLHKKAIIEVSTKVAETPSSNDPNKPQGSLWVTIVDQPEIVQQPKTQVRIFPKKFRYLRDTLSRMVSKQSPKESKQDKKDADYKITYTKQRQILLNDNAQIGKPDFNSENDLVFSLLYEHPNERFTREQIEKEVGVTLTKSLHKIVENLGFEGDTKEAFFSVSKNAIQFRNPVTKEQLREMRQPFLKTVKGGGKIVLPD